MFARTAAFAVILALPFVAGGCEVSIGGNTVSKAEVEQKIVEQLTEQVGTAPDKVECPEDLKAKVDTKMICVLTAPNGDTIDVTVTVTSVKHKVANFDIVVADQKN